MRLTFRELISHPNLYPSENAMHEFFHKIGHIVDNGRGTRSWNRHSFSLNASFICDPLALFHDAREHA
jgi:hypothetical protein